MKDLTSTSFGVLISFFLPGLFGFFSLSFYSADVKNIFDKLLDAQSSAGLFLVFAGALIIGLEISLLRWLVFERYFCKSVRFDPTDLARLATDENKLAAFRAVVDEHYRYHQFWGGMFIVIPVFSVGWLRASCESPHCVILSSMGFLLMEVITGFGAASAFTNCITCGKEILKGD